MPYPVSADLTTFLTDSGLTAPSATTLAQAVNAAVEAWEQSTGYIPFISTGSDTTRYYDPNGTDYIDLRAGVVAVTSVTTGLSPTDTTGTVLAVNEDFWLTPTDATERERPHTGIRFRTRQRGDARSVKVIGKFGYCLTGAFPADAFLAILKKAAAIVLPIINNASTGAAQKVKQRDVEYTYGDGSANGLSASINTYDSAFRMAVARYRLTKLY